MKIKGYLFSIFLSYANLIFSILLTFLISRNLNIEHIGFFYSVFVAQQYIGYLLTLGVGTALIAEYGKKNEVHDKYIYKNFHEHIKIINLLFFILLSIFLLLNNKFTFLLIIIVLLGFWRVIYEDLLLTKCNVFYCSFPTFFEILSRIIILLIFDINTEISIVYMIIASSLIGLLVNLFIFYLERIKIFDSAYNEIFVDYERYKKVSYYFFTHLISFTQMKLGLLISPIVFGNVFTGIYALLLNFCETPLKFTTIISRFVLKASNQSLEIKNSFKLVCYFTFSLSLIILILSFIFYDYINVYFYSNKIEGFELYFLILSFYSFFSIVSNLYVNFLNGIGKVKVTLVKLKASLFLHVLLIIISVLFDSQVMIIMSLSVSVSLYAMLLHDLISKVRK